MILAITYIFLFLGISIICCIGDKTVKHPRLQEWLMSIVFIIAMSTIAYYMKALPTWDLGRNYLLLDHIRTSNLSFFQFVFGGREFYNYDGYRSLIAYNIYRYIIVTLSSNNAWFQTIATFIVYSLQFYIISDYKKIHQNNIAPISLTMLISFTFLPFLYITSGVRNALASSIAGVSVYLYLNKSFKIRAFILLIVAATIHPSTLIVIPFAVLSKLQLGLKSIIIVVISSWGFQAISLLMVQSKILYVRQLGSAYLHYSGNNQYRGGRGNLYGILIISFFLVIQFFLSYRKKRIEKFNETYVENFLILMLIYILGNFQNYDLVLRPGYILGMFAPFFANKMKGSIINFRKEQNIAVQIGLNIIIIFLCIYVNYKCMQIFIDAFR